MAEPFFSFLEQVEMQFLLKVRFHRKRLGWEVINEDVKHF